MKDDSVSRAAVLNLIEQSCCDLEYACDNVALRKEVEALPSAQPDVPDTNVGDMISRQGVLRLLNAVPSEEFATKAMLIGGVNALPSAQLAQDLTKGCTDTISRAAVLNLIEQSCCDLEFDCDNVALRKEVEALPSAQTELENKIRAIGYTGREGRIYIGGRLFAVRELAQ